MKARTFFASLTIALAVNVVLYAGLVALYPLGAGLLKPRTTWAQQAGGLPSAGFAHAAILLLLFAVYAAVIWRASVVRAQISRIDQLIWLVVFGWLAFSIILLFAFPGESADIFDYIFRGRMMANYGSSPLVITPAALSNKPFHRYLSWSNWVDAYGPLWEYASAAVSRWVAQTASPAEMRVTINQTCDVQPALCTLLAKYVMGYRLMAISLTGLCGFLIFAGVQQRTSDNTKAALALLIWLWNPLVIISMAVGAHNDALMIVFILLAMGFAMRGRWLPALLFIFAAAHVKFTALVALPVLCLWMLYQAGWRRALGVLLISLAIVLPVSFALYAPLGGWSTLPRNLHERSLISVNSLGELGYLFLREFLAWKRPAAQSLVSRVSGIAFAAVSIFILYAAWQKRTHAETRAGASSHWLHILALVIAAYFALGSFWFQSWYLMLFVALIALLPLSRQVPIMIAYCAGALFAALVADYLQAGGFAPLWSIRMLAVALILAPAAITWMALRFNAKSSDRFEHLATISNPQSET